MINRATGASPASIDQLSHSVVTEWIESENISLHPTQKLALENAIAESVPLFLQNHPDQALDQYTQSIREDERKICMDALATIEESFPGFVSKQRLLNICAYPNANHKDDSA